MRTSIELPDEMLASLVQIGEIEKKAQGDLIREAIQTYLNNYGVSTMENAFGLWSSYDNDALGYERGIRDEWERD